MPLYAVDVRADFSATRTTSRDEMPSVAGWDPYWVGERGDVVHCIFEREVEVEAEGAIEARAKAPEAAMPLAAEGWDIVLNEAWSDCMAYERDAAGPTP